MENHWYALYTKSRHEKLIDGELQKRRIECFLPLRRIKKRWSDRTVTVEEPLFKSYVFVKGAPQELREALKTKGAVKFISAASAPVPVRQAVIDALKNIVLQDLAVDPFPYLDVGARVGVQSGIFKGIEGHVVRKDSKRCRLVVSIDALKASISVEVDACLVENV